MYHIIRCTNLKIRTGSGRKSNNFENNKKNKNFHKKRKTHATEKLVYDADLGEAGGNEAAYLGEDGNETVLTKEGALASHIGPCQKPGPLSRGETEVVAREILPLLGLEHLNHRVAATYHLKVRACVHSGSHILVFCGHRSQGTGHI